jgi:hypothetical protein
MTTAVSTIRNAGGLALTGGILFVFSLGWSLYVYLWVFGAHAGPWASDRGWRAVAIDTVLFTAFALHHSVFARLRVRSWVAARVQPGLERSVYVIVASGLFVAVLAWWVPVPGVAWRATGGAAIALHVVQLTGLLLTAHAARRLGVLSLAGIAQAGSPEPSPRPDPGAPGGRASRAQPDRAAPMLRQTGVYAWVRHPIYLAWLLMVWPAPVMTGSRLLFALLSTIYLVVAVPFEERTLARDLGAAYAEYRRTVRWRMVPFVY